MSYIVNIANELICGGALFEIVFYRDAKGNCEFENFLNELDMSHQRSDTALLKKIFYQLDLLEVLGRKMKEPHAKFIKGYRHPIMELRPMPERIFYVAWDKNKFLILNHYTKKQNKTNVNEIEKALNNLDDWIERHGD